MVNLNEVEIIKTLSPPLNFYRFLFGTNYLHFGFWHEEQLDLKLSEAQRIRSQKIFEAFPPPPARILDVGCRLGATTEDLIAQGYDVVAIATLEEVVTFDQQYDVILLQESLQYFSDLETVFKKAKSLLSSNGNFILCDEVSYSPETTQFSAIHQAKEIEKAFSAEGFYVVNHQNWGKNVIPTCQYVIDGFQQNRAILVELFGEQSNQNIEHFLHNWQQRLKWFSNEKLGYEYWVLLPSDFQIRTYQSGDENSILETFNEVFKTQRTLEHWEWKYLNNPYGKTWISAVWHQNKIVAQYAGYPLPLYFQGNQHVICHVGDVFSVSKYRKIGRGETALISRSLRHYEQSYFNNQVIFAYGFVANESTHQRLGTLFWKYNILLPVYQHLLNGEKLLEYKHNNSNMKTWIFKLKGYFVQRTNVAGEWADNLFKKVKDNYGWLLVRDQMYLKWRYEQHPDFNHEFFVIYHWGKPIGWVVGRLANERWLLGDALFDPKYAKIAFQLVLNKLLKENPQIEQIDSWFSEVPSWWNYILDELGFIKQRQFQKLDVIDKIYLGKITHEELAQNFYFTWGDSDLY
ncbi:MAG: hypothetical protein RIT27_66 [Pseudomonadota bacterium]